MVALITQDSSASYASLPRGHHWQSVSTRAQTFDELYFQSAPSSWSPNDVYLLDSILPVGKIYNSSQGDFETQVLAANQTFMYYHIKLWILPGTIDMQAQDYVLHAYVGVHVEGQSPEWVISDQELLIPTYIEFDEIELKSVPIAVAAGQRLILRLELSFSGQIFFWGGKSKPSSLVTNYAAYQGVPVSELPTSLVLMLRIAVLTAGSLARRPWKVRTRRIDLVRILVPAFAAGTDDR